MDFNMVMWRNPIVLRIGNFVISFRNDDSLMRMEIPNAGMAFRLTDTSPVDFTFTLHDLKPEHSGKLLYGSDEYIVPTHLYLRDSGEYEWQTLQDKKSKRLSIRINSFWSDFTLYEDETGTDGELAFYEFGHLFSYAVLNHHACVLHGVVMEYEGRGILICAAAGTGKTTHTRMWRDYENALIINGDRCLCRKIDGEWYAFGMPWSGSSGEYINRKVKISAIVALERGDDNYVTALSLKESTLYLMQRMFIPQWPGELQLKALDLCDELAAEIPILQLHCTPDLRSVHVLKQALQQLFNDQYESD